MPESIRSAVGAEVSAGRPAAGIQAFSQSVSGGMI